MNISEKVAYIKGLVEGMKIDAESDQGKITVAILGVLNDIALELEEVNGTIDDIAEVMADIEETVENLDEAVEEIEEELYGSDYDDNYDFGDDELYEITCRKCGNTVAVDMGMLEDGSVNCPNCGDKFEFNVDFIGGNCPDCNEQ